MPYLAKEDTPNFSSSLSSDLDFYVLSFFFSFEKSTILKMKYRRRSRIVRQYLNVNRTAYTAKRPIPAKTSVKMYDVSRTKFTPTMMVPVISIT